MSVWDYFLIVGIICAWATRAPETQYRVPIPKLTRWAPLSFLCICQEGCVCVCVCVWELRNNKNINIIIVRPHVFKPAVWVWSPWIKSFLSLAIYFLIYNMPACFWEPTAPCIASAAVVHGVVRWAKKAEIPRSVQTLHGQVGIIGCYLFIWCLDSWPCRENIQCTRYNGNRDLHPRMQYTAQTNKKRM